MQNVVDQIQVVGLVDSTVVDFLDNLLRCSPNLVNVDRSVVVQGLLESLDQRGVQIAEGYQRVQGVLKFV